MRSPNTTTILLKVAGYHGDSQSFLRITAESKMPYSDAGLAFEQGRAMREQGFQCHCHNCSIRKEITR